MFAGDGKYIPPPVFMLVLLSEKCYNCLLYTSQYDRNDMDFHRGTFRVRGDVLEIFPAEETDKAVRCLLYTSRCV